VKQARSVLLREGGITFFGSLFNQLFRYLFLASVTYLIKPSIFGEFVFVISSLSLIYGVFNTNFYRFISYQVPKQLKKGSSFNPLPTMVSIFLISVLVLTIVGTSIIILSKYLVNILGIDVDPSLFIILSPILILYLIRDIQKETFRAFEKVRYNVYVYSLIFPVLRFIFTISFLLLASNVVSLAFGIIISLSISIMIGMKLLWSGLLREQYSFEFQLSRENVPLGELVNYSLPLSVTGVVSTGITYVDVILLGVFAASSAPGLFRVAFSVAALSKLASQMFKSISKPLYSRMSNEDGSSLTDFYLTTSRWNAIVTIPVAGFLFTTSDPVINVLFDSSYSQASSAVPVLIIGMAFTKVWGNPQQLLEAIGNTRQLFWRGLCILSVNIVMDILLIPKFGIFGAAVGTSLGLISGTLLSIYFVKLEIGMIPITRFHLVYLISGIVSVALCVHLIQSKNSIISVIHCLFSICLCYISSIIILKGISEEDISVLNLLSRRIEKRTGISFFWLVSLLRRRTQ
jgi:O-antigen/teichoic acid export membrane protein